ncbi:alpha/beta fold hydrolase [Nocardioides sp. B-3]|uniref:alpha/beta fold hydrolase n=1 Tax=Nocardioides sp. B-3 TaxID=2895565 RepID=UPI002152A07C|nr:alpha/beta fold hydrolase [Nocardioides sp. B-3]UUZ61005.1 alpha/beta fold hydrolase [Nocardioides sp. B-3]
MTLEQRAVRGTHWGTGPAVYLVHGWGGLSDQLARFVEPPVASGHRVVVFDGPSHGESDPGHPGPRSASAPEFGRALDAVAAEFGPAAAVIAHSMGGVATLLALRHGSLTAGRLVLLAPMVRLSTHRDALWAMLGVGPRTSRRADVIAERRVGHPVSGVDLFALRDRVEGVPTLVVHDRHDRTTPFAESADWASAVGARFFATTGLGHHQILYSPTVVKTATAFVAGEEGAASARDLKSA